MSKEQDKPQLELPHGSKYRVSWAWIAAGQPRPYADTIHHVRVIFEVFISWLGDDNDPRSKWERNRYFKEEQVREILKTLPVGFPKVDKPDGWWETKLDWIRNIEPGVWEFHTTTAYTD